LKIDRAIAIISNLCYGSNMKISHYLTTTVREGSRLEVILIISKPEKTPDSSILEEHPIVENRQAFLRLPIAERGRILERQAEIALSHYQQDTDCQEWVDLDIAETHEY
jgi:hypothetical protein